MTTSSLADLAVTDAKLATIKQAGKIDNSATTATSGNTQNTIVLRDANKGFEAGALTLSGKVVQHSDLGLVATGTFNNGTIPIEGGGVRMMWYPAKAAFRAGSLGTGSQDWNDSNIGLYSVAMGTETRASGTGSVAMGRGAQATGSESFAMGNNVLASGAVAIAMGNAAQATGFYSVAIQRGSTNSKTGAFVYGDNTNATQVAATRDQQFVVRAQHFWLGTHNTVTNPAGEFITTSTGAHLTTGGVWTNSSDVNRKHRFQAVDAEGTLERLAALPITAWTYRGEADSVRHLGPTAQDFYAAFGLGQTNTGIGTVDADGVSLLATQALERRTRALAQENAALRAQVTDLERRLARLEAASKP